MTVRTAREVKQIAFSDGQIVALCSDDSIWIISSNPHMQTSWTQIRPIPPREDRYAKAGS